MSSLLFQVMGWKDCLRLDGEERGLVGNWGRKLGLEEITSGLD